MEYSRKYSRKTKKIPVSLENICIQIKRKMFPHRLAKNTKRCAVYARVLRLRSERSYNPIKVGFFFFCTNCFTLLKYMFCAVLFSAQEGSTVSATFGTGGR